MAYNTKKNPTEFWTRSDPAFIFMKEGIYSPVRKRVVDYFKLTQRECEMIVNAEWKDDKELKWILVGFGGLKFFECFKRTLFYGKE